MLIIWALRQTFTPQKSSQKLGVGHRRLGVVAKQFMKSTLRDKIKTKIKKVTLVKTYEGF